MGKAERMQRTARHVERQRKIYEIWPRPASLPSGYFKKMVAMGCKCRKKKHGQPRRSSGICFLTGMSSMANERVTGKRLARAWLFVDDLLDCEL